MSRLDRPGLSRSAGPRFAVHVLCTNPVALVRDAFEICRSGDWSWKVLRSICAGTCTAAGGGDGGGGGGANDAHLAATVDFAAHLTHACTVGVGAANFASILEYSTHAAAALCTKVS